MGQKSANNCGFLKGSQACYNFLSLQLAQLSYVGMYLLMYKYVPLWQFKWLLGIDSLNSILLFTSKIHKEATRCGNNQK